MVIEAWRKHYNAVRPHSSLTYMTPHEFKQHQLHNPPIPNRAICLETIGPKKPGRSVTVSASGGAAMQLARELRQGNSGIDFSRLFHRKLAISATEPRDQVGVA